jgi:RNA polymerase sigma-70 factor, ECF subfamily
VNAVAPAPGQSRAAFERVLVEMRPALHRYCARMSGSVLDGEDIVQDAVVKAMEAFDETAMIANLEGWLFRIAHNAALDFLRRRSRSEARFAEAELDAIADPFATAEHRQAAAAGLRSFMRLPVAQRSSVILMDVLGYSLEEIGTITGATIPSVKAALHRGRTRLGEIAKEPDDAPLPPLVGEQRHLLATYVDRFNARDFDAIRAMLADEVRLELVDRVRKAGRHEVEGYFENYASRTDWRFAAGQVEGRAAALAYGDAGALTYFVLLEWAGGGVEHIRDFRYARYAVEGAEITLLD